MGKTILTDRVALDNLTAPIPVGITSLNEVKGEFDIASEKLRSDWHGRSPMQYATTVEYIKYLINRETNRIMGTIDVVDITLEEREEVDQMSTETIGTENN